VTAIERPDNAARPAGKAQRPDPAGTEDQGTVARGGGGHNEGYAVFGYLISGMAVYGGIGWLAGHLTGLTFLFPVGMLIGLALGIVLILYRYGKA
jgi:ATP synthase protein I